MEDSVVNFANFNFFAPGGGHRIYYIGTPTFQRNLFLPFISIIFFFEVLVVDFEISASSCHCELPLCLVKRNPTKTFGEWKYNTINS